LLGVVLALAMVATPALAQPRCAPCARSDSAFAHLDALGSLTPALAGLRADSNDVAMLWRASRAELTLGIVASERAAVDAHYARATAYARRAVKLAPNDAGPHFWLAAALGRRALRAGFRQGVSLTTEAYREASRALAIDSMHAGAHDIIGKVHSEVRKLPWMVRRMAASMTKLDVARTASWETAEMHLKRAIALDPALMMARVDLSQLYLRTGRRPEAIAIVEALEKMPRHTPADAWFQGEARKRLSWYP